MAPSMRKLSIMGKKRDVRDAERRQQREMVLQLFKDGISRAEIVRRVGISRSTCDRLCTAARQGDNSYLQRLLNPAQNRAGRRPVITKEEDVLIKQRINYCAERGFALDKYTLKSIMAKIASDDRSGFLTSSGAPSDDAIRYWRARNRDITYRKAENKTSAKIFAERFEHVASYETALRSIESKHPGIFKCGDRLWNMDETAVSAEFGQPVKVFSTATSHHGGARRRNGAKQAKHITALLAVSASGRKAPPIFIVAGKYVMSKWFEPLSRAEAAAHPDLLWLGADDWMPKDAVVLMSENSSIEKRLIKLVVEHINKYVRLFLPAELAFCLTLDGHSSREGSDWLHFAQSVKCEVVQSPSDTSHFLQACDKRVNKSFKKAIRSHRDVMCSAILMDTCSIRAGLMLGVYAFHRITVDDVTHSFEQTGLWPMDYRFINKFIDENNKKEQLKERVKEIEQSQNGTQSVEQKVRQSDSSTWAEIEMLLNKPQSAAEGLQALNILLQQRVTVNSILMQAIQTPSVSTAQSDNRNRNEVLYKGTPASVLTHGEVLAIRDERIIQEQAQSAERDRVRAEKERARAERYAQKERDLDLQRAKKAAREEARRQKEALRVTKAQERQKLKAERAAAREMKKQELAAGKAERASRKASSATKKRAGPTPSHEASHKRTRIAATSSERAAVTGLFALTVSPN